MNMAHKFVYWALYETNMCVKASHPGGHDQDYYPAAPSVSGHCNPFEWVAVTSRFKDKASE